GFASNFDASGNRSFYSNASKTDSFAELNKSYKAVAEFYNPWSHRMVLQTTKNSNEELISRQTAVSNASLMSPSNVNLDALVSKLIADDDSIADCVKSNDPKVSAIENSDNRNKVIEKFCYWSIKEKPSFSNHIQAQIKPETSQTSSVNPFAQSTKMGSCFANEDESNFSGGDYLLPNNKVNSLQFNGQLQPSKIDTANYKMQTNAIYNYQPNLQLFEQNICWQKTFHQQEQEQFQHLHQNRQATNPGQTQNQIRSIRAAVRNSHIAGIAPLNDLNYRVDRCYEQFRLLEKERKKIETELCTKFGDKKVLSANNIAIPRLPQNPTRIDRLIVDQYREHAKVVTLIAMMETLQVNREMYVMVHSSIQKWLESIRNLQYKRKDDLLTASKPRMNDVAEDMCDYLCSQISLAVHELCGKTRCARTALWCASVQLIENAAESSNESRSSPPSSAGASHFVFP
ncbi:uncharacterized protein B4U79_06074, partial [Dinothrombium tinctorium]